VYNNTVLDYAARHKVNVHNCKVSRVVSSTHCNDLFCSGAVQESHSSLKHARLLAKASQADHDSYSLGRKQGQIVYSSTSKIRIANESCERLSSGARPEATKKLMT